MAIAMVPFDLARGLRPLGPEAMTVSLSLTLFEKPGFLRAFNDQVNFAETGLSLGCRTVSVR